MMDNTHISDLDFKSRFATLVLGGGGSLPKKPLDRHILYLSVMLGLEPNRMYSEKELNAELIRWVERFGSSFGLDHVSLRRNMVDEGYVQRDTAGHFYQLSPEPPYRIEPPAGAIDLEALVEAEHAAREERKRRFTAG
jgi:hypothetical protein